VFTGRPAGGHRRDRVDGGETDQPVHEPASRVRLPEALAEDPGDEVELGYRDETPVEPADDQQGPGEYIELSHLFVYLLSRNCTEIGTIENSSDLVKQLSRSCIVRPVASTGEVLRIGELSKRVGVSPELLRAWERRYGLLHPARSAGGLRLYSPADIERVAVMQQHLAEGMAAAEAAALAVRDVHAEEAARAALRPDAIRAELAEALDAFDEPRAQAILDRLLALATVETLLSEVIVPYLEELGERWKRGEASVAQEHFASGVLRGRLLGLARGWGLGLGPAAVLACLPGEQHDLGLIAFGLALRSRGWRIIYLGPDSPIDTVADVSGRTEPDLVVLNAVSGDRLRPVLPELRALARRHRVALGGAAAEDHILENSGIIALTRDPTAEAARVSTLTPSGHNSPGSGA
jgi:MerR family transcriptional regulator, light-induced transcriptional regulator